MAEFKFKSAFFPDINMKALVETIELSVPLSSKPLKVVSIQDVLWAGERMLEATLSHNQCPPILIHFPLGTAHRRVYLAQGMLGMMEVAAEAGINIPTVLYARKPPSLDVGRAMVMLLKDTSAQPLMEIWPRLCKTRKEAVVKESASVMLKLYRYNVGSICTTRRALEKGLPTRDNSGLSIPCFFQGPLASVPPRTACPTAVSYFQSLANQMRILMDIAERNPNAFVSFWPSIDPQVLTEEERKAIRDTWTKLCDLAPYHCLPSYATAPVVGQAVAEYAEELFLKQRTGIYHDLDLPRLLVSFEGGNAKIIVGSGWEYSYHAPHWSVSRMPSWLVPEYSGPRMPPFTKHERLKICDSIYEHIQKESQDWIICYALGIPNRYFEDCLKASWISRKAVECRLKLLEEFWRRDHFFPWPITEQGTVVNAQHYTEWCYEYCQKHPKFLAVRDIWGTFRVSPTCEILTHANGRPHQNGTSGPILDSHDLD